MKNPCHQIYQLAREPAADPILKLFIGSIIMLVVFGLFIAYTNYRNRKFSTVNLTFS